MTKLPKLPKKLSYETELKKRYPRNAKLQKMLLTIPENINARFSLDSIDPDDIVAQGEYTFVRELYKKDKPIKASNSYIAYESKVYTDPTYRDAWREFKKGQKAVLDELGEDFTHVFLEDISPGKHKNTLTFGTGS